MTWQRRQIYKLLVIVVILGAAVFYFQTSGINYGLDLQGGVHILLEAQDTEERQVDHSIMQQALTIIERRVDQLGLTEPLIQQEGERRIIVELPGEEDPERAIDLIGQTAMLRFIGESEHQEVVIDDDQVVPGELVITGEHLTDVQATRDSRTRNAVINFELDREGSRIFARYTANNIGNRIAIYLDDELLTNPTVQSEIRGQGQITGYESLQEAQNHALLLRAGSLPVPLERLESRAVGPTLGQLSIDRSIIAGLIGLALVIVFMVFLYKGPGLLAAVALLCYSIFVLGVLSALQATLTLPGIAGLILSIGMAVDANIIIFERLKEELRSGKSMRASIENGFKRAMLTIVDANVTTLIAAIILAYFGTGPIRGFAVTLSIGILASMFSAIVITRTIMELASKTVLITSFKGSVQREAG